MKNINLAISCCGSGIGQSIIDSCKLSNLPLTTFGLDNSPFAYGLYECDYIIKTPKVNNENYIENIISICLDNDIQIIIPGIDEELKLFSKNLKKFNEKGIEVIVSDESFLDLVRDKALATDKLNNISDIFVKSFANKEEFLEGLDKKQIDFPVIAKPSAGSASAGVYILFDRSDLQKLNEDHIIQEIAKPHRGDANIAVFEQLISKKINPQVSEISIQLVTNKKGDLLGRMASFNRLKNGVPIEIIPYDDCDFRDQIDKLIPSLRELGLKGPVNLQGRITDEGLKIFELNARFTGITGLRALMGFNEVEACIKSWLGLNEEEDNILKINNDLFGVRQISSKTVHKDRNPLVKSVFSKVNNSNTKTNKKIVLTGATGFVGRNLIDALLSQNSDYTIAALVRNKETAKLLLPKSVELYDSVDFEKGSFSFGNFDSLLHLGFARPHKTNEEIAESLAFTAKIFRSAVDHNLSEIINLSSQSVYGQSSMPPWNEETVPAPNTPYSSAKYCTELLLNELAHQKKHIKTSSIRLASTTGGANGLIDIDIMSRFVKKIKNQENLTVIGGMQKVERLDIRDAVSGIISLLNTTGKWRPVYNLGPSNQINLIELAEQVIKTGKTYYKNNRSKIDLLEKENLLNFGMDINSFKKDTGWEPKYSIEDTIHSLFNYDY